MHTLYCIKRKVYLIDQMALFLPKKRVSFYFNFKEHEKGNAQQTEEKSSKKIELESSATWCWRQNSKKLTYTPTLATQKMSCVKDCIEILSPDDFYIQGDGFCFS